MRHCLLIFCLLSLAGKMPGAIVLFQEGFESDGQGSRYTVTGGFNDGDDDYFQRTDGTDSSGLPLYENISGSHFWAAEDTASASNPNTDLSALEFTDIDITGHSELTFELHVGAGSTVAFDDFEDYLSIQYRIDGGFWEEILRFENDGNGSNGALYQDTNLDGVGDGSQLTLSLTSYSVESFGTGGDSLDLKLETILTSGSEAIAFDQISVTAVPEPATFAFACAIAVLIFRRINNNSGSPFRRA